MLDETGFYAPSVAHNALPSRPWLGISAYLSIILQYLNRFAIRSRGSVPCPMAGRRFPTFVPHVVAQSLTRVNSSNALARVMRSTSSGVVPLISAIFLSHMECLTNHSACLDVAPEPCMDSLSQEGFYQVEALTLSVPASLHS